LLLPLTACCTTTVVVNISQATTVPYSHCPRLIGASLQKQFLFAVVDLSPLAELELAPLPKPLLCVQPS